MSAKKDLTEFLSSNENTDNANGNEAVQQTETIEAGGFFSYLDEIQDFVSAADSFVASVSSSQYASAGDIYVSGSEDTQIIVLDFDGAENVTYANGDFSREGVYVEAASIPANDIEHIVSSLNELYASRNVVFVLDAPETGDYSTIYVGATTSFDDLGSFKGLSETIDIGNLNKNDNAFVNTLNTNGVDDIIATIDHEAGHLVGTLEHGGEGISVFANTSGTTYYVNSDWFGKANGEVVSGTSPSGIVYTATIGTDAFSTIAGAVNAASLDSAVHVIGGTYDDSSYYYFNGKKVEWEAGTAYGIYGGNASGTGNITGDTLVTVTGGEITEVYGGGYETDVSGTATVVFKNATSYWVQGGGWSGAVGNTSVHVTDATIYNEGDSVTKDPTAYIIGGGYSAGGDVGSSVVIVDGTTTVIGVLLNDPSNRHYGYVFGGGLNGANTASTDVTVVGSAYITSGVLGGGGNFNGEVSSVSGNTKVTIGENAEIGTLHHEGYIYGGGWNQSVGGNTEVNIKDNAKTFHGVYGGGLADTRDIAASAKITGNTVVNISDNVQIGGNVAGGGWNADVGGNTVVNISGGTITGGVYGAGWNGNVAGTATINITGGTIAGEIAANGVNGGTVTRAKTLNIGSDTATKYVATFDANNKISNFSRFDIYNADLTFNSGSIASINKFYGNYYTTDTSKTINVDFNGGTYSFQDMYIGTNAETGAYASSVYTFRNGASLISTMDIQATRVQDVYIRYDGKIVFDNAADTSIKAVTMGGLLDVNNTSLTVGTLNVNSKNTLQQGNNIGLTTVKNGAILSGTTANVGTDRNSTASDRSGAVDVDATSTFTYDTINAGGTGTGIGKITVAAGGTFTAKTVSINATSSITAKAGAIITVSQSLSIASGGSFTIDCTDVDGSIGSYKIFSGFDGIDYNNITISGLNSTLGYEQLQIGNDLFLGKYNFETLAVDSTWTGKEIGSVVTVNGVDYYYGINAFASLSASFDAIVPETGTILLESDITEAAKTFAINENLIISTTKNSGVAINSSGTLAFTTAANKKITIDEKVTINSKISSGTGSLDIVNKGSITKNIGVNATTLNNSGSMEAEGTLLYTSGISSITNSGTMKGNAASDQGVAIRMVGSVSGSEIINQAGGNIYGANAAIYVTFNPEIATFNITNAGTIASDSDGYSIYLEAYGSTNVTVINSATGIMTGMSYFSNTTLTLENEGTINGNITGEGYNAGSLINKGTINGDILFDANGTGESADDKLELAVGSTVSGKIDFGIGNDTFINNIKLASNVISYGTLTVSGYGSFTGNVHAETLIIAENNTMNLEAGALLTVSKAFSGTISVDASNATKGIYKVIDNTSAGSLDYTNVSIVGTGYYKQENNGDLYITNADKSTFKVNASWNGSEYGTEVENGYYFGINAFSSAQNAADAIVTGTTSEIVIAAGNYGITTFTKSVTITSNGATFDLTGSEVLKFYTDGVNSTSYIISANSIINAPSISLRAENAEGKTQDGLTAALNIAGTVVLGGNPSVSSDELREIWIRKNTTLTVDAGGKIQDATMFLNRGTAVIKGTIERLSLSGSGSFALAGTALMEGAFTLDGGTFTETGHTGQITFGENTAGTIGSISTGHFTNGSVTDVVSNVYIGGKYNYQTASFDNGWDAVVTIDGGSSFATTGYLQVGAKGTLNIDNATVSATNGIKNAGSITLNSSNPLTFGGTFSNTGTISVTVPTTTAPGLYKIIDNIGSTAMTLADYGTVNFATPTSDYVFTVVDNDLYATNAMFYITQGDGSKVYYTTFADAVAGVADGGTINVRAGSYTTVDALTYDIAGGKSFNVAGETDTNGTSLVKWNGSLSITGGNNTTQRINGIKFQNIDFVNTWTPNGSVSNIAVQLQYTDNITFSGCSFSNSYGYAKGWNPLSSGSGKDSNRTLFENCVLNGGTYNLYLSNAFANDKTPDGYGYKFLDCDITNVCFNAQSGFSKSTGLVIDGSTLTLDMNNFILPSNYTSAGDAPLIQFGASSQGAAGNGMTVTNTEFIMKATTLSPDTGKVWCIVNQGGTAADLIVFGDGVSVKNESPDSYVVFNNIFNVAGNYITGDKLAWFDASGNLITDAATISAMVSGVGVIDVSHFVTGFDASNNPIYSSEVLIIKDGVNVYAGGATFYVNEIYAGNGKIYELADGSFVKVGDNAANDITSGIASLTNTVSTFSIAAGTYSGASYTFLDSIAITRTESIGVVTASTAAVELGLASETWDFAGPVEANDDAKIYSLNGDYSFKSLATAKFGNVKLTINGNVTLETSAWFKAGTETTITASSSLVKDNNGDGMYAVYGTLNVYGELAITSRAMGAALVVGLEKYGAQAYMNVVGSSAVVNIKTSALNGYQTRTLPITVDACGTLTVSSGATFNSTGRIDNSGTITMSDSTASLDGLNNLTSTASMSFTNMNMTAGGITNAGTFSLSGTNLALSGTYKYWPHGYVTTGEEIDKAYDYVIDNTGTINLTDSTLSGNTIKNSSGIINVYGNSEISGAMSGSGSIHFGSADKSVNAIYNIGGNPGGALTLVNGSLNIKGENLTTVGQIVTIGGWSGINDNGLASGTMTIAENAIFNYAQIRIGDANDSGNVHKLIINGTATSVNGGYYQRYMAQTEIGATGVLNVNSLLSNGGTITNNGGTINVYGNVTHGSKGSGSTPAANDAVITLNDADMNVVERSGVADTGNFRIGYADEDIRNGKFVMNGASTLTVQHAFEIGSVTDGAKNGGKGTVTVSAGSKISAETISVVAGSSISLELGALLSYSTSITNSGIIDYTGTISDTYYVYKLVDYTGTGTASDYSSITVNGASSSNLVVKESDLYLANVDMTTLIVDASLTTKNIGDVVTINGTDYFYGFNAFSSINTTFGSVTTDTTKVIVNSVITEKLTADYNFNKNNVLITTSVANGVVVDINPTTTWAILGSGGKTITIDENVTVTGGGQIGAYYGNMIINGTVGAFQLWATFGDLTINSTASVSLGYGDGKFFLRDTTVNITGSLTSTAGDVSLLTKQVSGRYIGIDTANSSILNMSNTFVSTSYFTDSRTGNTTFTMTMDNSILQTNNDGSAHTEFNLASTGANVTMTNGSRLITRNNISIASGNTMSLTASSMEIGKNISLAGVINLDTASSISFKGALTNTGTINVTVDPAVLTGDYFFKVVDNTGTSNMTLADYGNLTANGAANDSFKVYKNDLYFTNASQAVISVKQDYTAESAAAAGYIFGFNAFATLTEAAGALESGGTIRVEDNGTYAENFSITVNGTIAGFGSTAFTVNGTITSSAYLKLENAALTTTGTAIKSGTSLELSKTTVTGKIEDVKSMDISGESTVNGEIVYVQDDYVNAEIRVGNTLHMNGNITGDATNNDIFTVNGTLVLGTTDGLITGSLFQFVNINSIAGTGTIVLDKEMTSTEISQWRTDNKVADSVVVISSSPSTPSHVTEGSYAALEGDVNGASATLSGMSAGSVIVLGTVTTPSGGDVVYERLAGTAAANKIQVLGATTAAANLIIKNDEVGIIDIGDATAGGTSSITNIAGGTVLAGNITSTGNATVTNNGTFDAKSIKSDGNITFVNNGSFAAGNITTGAYGTLGITNSAGDMTLGDVSARTFNFNAAAGTTNSINSITSQFHKDITFSGAGDIDVVGNITGGSGGGSFVRFTNSGTGAANIGGNIINTIGNELSVKNTASGSITSGNVTGNTVNIENSGTGTITGKAVSAVNDVTLKNTNAAGVVKYDSVTTANKINITNAGSLEALFDASEINAANTGTISGNTFVTPSGTFNGTGTYSDNAFKSDSLATGDLTLNGNGNLENSTVDAANLALNAITLEMNAGIVSGDVDLTAGADFLLGSTGNVTGAINMASTGDTIETVTLNKGTATYGNAFSGGVEDSIIANGTSTLTDASASFSGTLDVSGLNANVELAASSFGNVTTLIDLGSDNVGNMLEFSNDNTTFSGKVTGTTEDRIVASGTLAELAGDMAGFGGTYEAKAASTMKINGTYGDTLKLEGAGTFDLAATATGNAVFIESDGASTSVMLNDNNATLSGSFDTIGLGESLVYVDNDVTVANFEGDAAKKSTIMAVNGINTVGTTSDIRISDTDVVGNVYAASAIIANESTSTIYGSIITSVSAEISGGSYRGAYLNSTGNVSVNGNAAAATTVYSMINSDTLNINAASGKVTLANMLSASSMTFSGDGNNLSFTSLADGISNGSVTFDDYTGRFNGIFRNVSNIMISGDSSMTFGRIQSSGATLSFDLSGRDLAVSDNAMFTARTELMWEFTKTINVTIDDTVSNGTYLLGAGYDYANNGFTFNVSGGTIVYGDNTVSVEVSGVTSLRVADIQSRIAIDTAADNVLTLAVGAGVNSAVDLGAGNDKLAVGSIESLAGTAGATNLVKGGVANVESYEVNGVAVTFGDTVKVYDNADDTKDIYAKLSNAANGDLVISWGKTEQEVTDAAAAFETLPTPEIGTAVVSNGTSFDTLTNEEFVDKKNNGSLGVK